MNSSLPVDVALFLSHLGLPLETIDKSVFSHADSPDFSLPDHSPLGAVLFKKLGFSLTFCPPDFYHMDEALANHPPIISNIQIYSGDSEYQHARYAGALPFGLAFENDRRTVIDKLGQPAWQYPFAGPIQLARFDFPGRWILVKYADGIDRISMIEVGLKPRKPRASVLPKIEQPDIHTLHSCFEKEWTEVSRYPGFAEIDLSELAGLPPGEECSNEVDALQTHGVELYFRQSKKTREPASVLTGARYIRRGVYWSRGFDGTLPKDIRFEDTPEVFLKKVGSYPVTGKADVLTGYFIWHLPEYLLQIGFSVMEQRINRVYIAAHSYYSESLLESPKLELPFQ